MLFKRKLAVATMFAAMFFTACENNNDDAIVENMNKKIVDNPHEKISISMFLFILIFFATRKIIVNTSIISEYSKLYSNCPADTLKAAPKLSDMNIRTGINEVIYQAIKKGN